MQAGERQLHLGLDTCDLRDTKARSLSYGVPQQRRLPDAGLATDDQNGAVTPAHIRQQLVEHFALASPAQETWSTVGGHLTTSLMENGCGRQAAWSALGRTLLGQPEGTQRASRTPSM
jgi:hypothetical protein